MILAIGLVIGTMNGKMNVLNVLVSERSEECGYSAISHIKEEADNCVEKAIEHGFWEKDDLTVKIINGSDITFL